MRATAEFLGQLLVREVDREQLTALRSAELATALASLGITLPDAGAEDEWLEQRAAEYHELFLRPEPGPLVQSLWTQGRYEGDATVRVRELAKHAGATFDRNAARGAAVDHLGCLMLLWAASSTTAPEVAAEIERAHLTWAQPGLRRIASTGGFYAGVASATLSWIDAVCTTE